MVLRMLYACASKERLMVDALYNDGGFPILNGNQILFQYRIQERNR